MLTNQQTFTYSVSVRQHIKLSKQICPRNTLACSWDINQPRNKIHLCAHPPTPPAPLFIPSCICVNNVDVCFQPWCWMMTTTLCLKWTRTLPRRTAAFALAPEPRRATRGLCAGAGIMCIVGTVVSALFFLFFFFFFQGCFGFCMWCNAFCCCLRIPFFHLSLSLSLSPLSLSLSLSLSLCPFVLFQLFSFNVLTLFCYALSYMLALHYEHTFFMLRYSVTVDCYTIETTNLRIKYRASTWNAEKVLIRVWKWSDV